MCMKKVITIALIRLLIVISKEKRNNDDHYTNDYIINIYIYRFYVDVELDVISNWHNFGIWVFHQSNGIFLTTT